MNRTAIALLTALAVLASGCGGKKPPAATTTSPAALGLTAMTCPQLIDLPVFFTDAITGLGSNLDQKAALLQRFAESSPLEIRPDFAVVATASATIATTLKGVHLVSGKAPSDQDLAKLRKLSRIDTERLTQSSANVSEWATKNCAGVK